MTSLFLYPDLLNSVSDDILSEHSPVSITSTPDTSAHKLSFLYLLCFSEFPARTPSFSMPLFMPAARTLLPLAPAPVAKLKLPMLGMALGMLTGRPLTVARMDRASH